MTRRVLLVVAVFVAGVALALAWPPRVDEAPPAAPALTREAAFERWAVLERADSMALHPGCGSTAFLHDRRSPRAFVLLHGITNCPLQFEALAESLHAAGDDVLVPRVPRHGLADRMTPELARLRNGELTALAAECVAIAAGLGDTVVVMGLSTSGVLAAWTAQALPGVHRAIVIAPALAPPWEPAAVAAIAARLAVRLPNQFVWWDEAKREALDGPTQCYPRFATRAMGEVFALAERLWARARREPPGALELELVTTAGDEAVNLPRVHALAGLWRARSANVREWEFPSGEKVVHDMVDPRQVGARVEAVYPLLIALARGEAPPASAAAVDRSAER